jgi:Tol biopolymer transport system component
VSPDGRDVLVAGEKPGDVADGLYRWSLDTGVALQLVPGGENTWYPAFAPDGSWMAVFQPGGNIARLPLAGGAPIEMTRDTAGSSTAAIVGDRLLYGDARRGLSVMPVNGGESRSLAEPDPDQGETLFYGPSPLPGGTHALFAASISTRGAAANRIMVIDLESGDRQTVLDNGEQPVYVPSGHMVFSRDGSIWAVAFDPDTREVRGEPIMIQDGVLFSPGEGAAWTVSQEGTLAYFEGESIEGAMELLLAGPDDTRDEAPTLIGGATFEWPMFSPSGRRLAAAIHGADQHGIWVYDVARGSRIRVSFVGNDGHPVWSPDGESIVFYSGTSNGGRLYRVAADGSDGETAHPIGDGGGRIPRSFSPDGRYLVFTQSSEQTGDDLWYVDLEGGEEAPLLATDFEETWGMVSPDGRWLAYTSDESGSTEVYLTPFPQGGAKVPVSTDGGDVPTWSPDGEELFYRRGPELIGVRVSGQERPEVGASRTVREDVGTYYYPEPGTDRMLLNRSEDRDVEFTDHVTVVLNWFEELRRRVPKN